MAGKTTLATPDPDDSGKRRKKAKPRKRANGEGHARERKDGRFEAQVFVTTSDGGRKRVSVYGKSYDQCQDELTKLRDQERQGLPAVTTTMTVGEYLTFWLYQVAEPGIRRTTFTTYEGAVRLHIIPGIGKRKLKQLQAVHIRTWLNGLRTKCQCCAQGKDAKRAEAPDVPAKCCAKATPECCGEYLSASSIRHLLRVLRAALQNAVNEQELIARNVARMVKLNVTDPHKVRALTDVEARQVLVVAKQHRLYALWAVALAIGLRRGEALGLSWNDIDMVRKRVTIRQALHRVDKQLKLEEVKTDESNATIPLPGQLVRVLKEHRMNQLQERFEAGDAWQETGLVFTTTMGGPIEPRNVNRMFARLCTQANVRQVRVHDLRHSCATLLFSMGVDAATVQRVLRHSSITVTTSTYVEVIERVQRDALDGMDAFFQDGDDEGSA
ncbi:site-specific integrase [Actinosynnema sp. NPDC023587]|uniref:tyrosine-type recombinase/integrase n=1 Tax=Actinosynnema sp. NPDC023587 TaxID=3154695 RepID=UPI0033C677EF